jgi:hypothetical protein
MIVLLKKEVGVVEILSVKIDGEVIHTFDSTIYIFESSTGYTLELTMIVSEIVVNKYRNFENLIVEVELKDGRLINSIMHLQNLSGGLPQLHLFCDVDDPNEYKGFDLVNESNPVFPKIGEGITLTEIRKYEMPNERVKLNLTLPIDQAEWIAKQKKSEIEKIVKAAIYEYWKRENK